MFLCQLIFVIITDLTVNQGGPDRIRAALIHAGKWKGEYGKCKIAVSFKLAFER